MKKILIIILMVLAVLGLAVWLGLPAGLRAMGLHPYYSGPKVQFPGGKVLIITTSHDRLGDKGSKTGVFASEMTASYYEFSDGGMKVDLASIKGGPIPIDPLSFKWFIKSSYKELGLTITPQHPERELRAAGTRFESQTAFRDFFANYSVVDGRLVTGQNQNAGAEVAQKMMMVAKGGLR